VNDGEALYRAILESPEDDAPRLLYADWLDEHGDVKRAEFIRLQCELSSLIMGSQEAFARYGAIQKQCWDLFNAHHKQWIQDLGPLPSPNIWYRRGLAAKVVCSVAYFVVHGDRLFDLAPIEEVEFTHFLPSDIRLLKACRCSSRVRRFRFVTANDNDQVIRSLLAQWPFPNLQVLELRVGQVDSRLGGFQFARQEPFEADQTAGFVCGRWAEVTTAIAGSECLRTLRRLSLARCGIGDAGGQALADSPHLDELTVLDLTDNPLSAVVRYRLLDRFASRVMFDYRDYAGFRAGDLFA
jgi:uncharacterized protein (TIGR02996 family)